MTAVDTVPEPRPRPRVPIAGLVALPALALAFGGGFIAGVLPAAAQPATPAPKVQPAPAESSKAVPAIEDGTVVQIEYTLKNDAGAVIDSNLGKEPLTYVHGKHQIIPGLEQALNGMRAGDVRSVHVMPKDAYGAPDPAAMVEVPRQVLPPEALVPGVWLTAQKQGGGTSLVKVKEVREQTVILDLNHPLAGQTLHFDVKILGVAPVAKPSEGP
jgi:FKBP-type peptidyl-prolyl cis-trans isomerase SlyD